LAKAAAAATAAAAAAAANSFVVVGSAVCITRKLVSKREEILEHTAGAATAVSIETEKA
jgi:hypothetical protein